jgi:putative tricarboxylic transport membrane protein
MLGVYVGGVYGGSLTSILISTPGTAIAAATLLEGPSLAKKGLTGKALSMTTIASFIGGIFSCIILIVVAPQLAKFALKFGPTQYFALAFFGLSVVAGVSSGSIFKGILAAILGMLLSTIGQDPITGTIRSTFGFYQLLSGISVVPALIGLFALPQAIEQLEDLIKGKIAGYRANASDSFIRWSDVKNNCYNFLRSSVIGTIIGVIPGVGSGIAAFFSYNKCKQASKTPERFGTGHLEGLVSTETANNAVTGGALIPLLTLSIPGDVITAILFGGLMIQGVMPGPLLFQKQPEIINGIFFSLIFANFFMLVLGLSSVKLISKIIEVPSNILMPIVIMFCVVGSYSINNSYFDVIMMTMFGIMGYGMKKTGLPAAPLLLGLLLSPIAETNLRRALTISKMDYSVFFTEPLSCILIVLGILSIAKNIRLEMKLKKEITSKVVDE